jgi:hypothetical protein
MLRDWSASMTDVPLIAAPDFSPAVAISGAPELGPDEILLRKPMALMADV